MQRVTIRTAKTTLPKLIEAALHGEDIVITKAGRPVVRLVPVTRNAFTIGLLKGKLGRGPDVFEPMDDSELDDWEGGA